MNHTQDYYRHQVERVSSNRNEVWNSALRENYISSRVEGKEDSYIFMGGYPETSTRFAKHKPLDCGTSGCYMCHGDKVKKRRYKLNGAQIQEMLYYEWGTPDVLTVQS